MVRVQVGSRVRLTHKKHGSGHRSTRFCFGSKKSGLGQVFFGSGQVGSENSDPFCHVQFCNKDQKCMYNPNISLDSLDLFVSGELSPKFTTYSKQRLMVLCGKRNQNKLKYKQMQKNIHTFETSTHSQPKEEIKRGREEERESSPIPIFPTPNFGIVKLHPS